VSTAILIFTKTNSGGTDKVWFYDMQADGMSLDDKRTQLYTDGETPTHEQSNIADILARFASLTNDNSTPNTGSPEYTRKKTEQSFMVSVDDIIDKDFDLSLNRYKEVIYEEIEYDEPKVILERIKTLQAKMTTGVAELEGLLK
jgi:type I restriction enzyme M protein